MGKQQIVRLDDVVTVANDRNGAAGVAEDFCGALRFYGQDTGGSATQFGKISGIIHNPVNENFLSSGFFKSPPKAILFNP